MPNAREEILKNVNAQLSDPMTIVFNSESYNFPVKRDNYQPTKNDKQFVVIGVDFDDSTPGFGYSIERGHIRVAVLVPARTGSGLALEACEMLDSVFGGGTIGTSKTQVLPPSQVVTVGPAMEDNTAFFRLDWSARFMHSE